MASQGKVTSSAMPTVTSSQTSALLPPLPPAFQKSAENALKKTTPVFTKATTVSSSTSTNSDLYTLILHMKGYMQQQDETNRRILREIDEMKKQKKSVGDHSPLVPRTLDFTTPPSIIQHSKASSVQYQGSLRLQHGSLAIIQPQVSCYLSGGYLETLSAQGSYFQHQGSSPQIQGSMEYPSRPSAPMYPGSNTFQDQGSSGTQPSRVLKFT
ncbi:hypothetical protein Hanom_Chr11g00993051 [Helianthus anomalus]